MIEHTGEQPAAARTPGPPAPRPSTPGPSTPGIPAPGPPTPGPWASTQSAPLRALLGVLDLVADRRYIDADEAARGLSFGSLVWGLAAPLTLPTGLLSDHWSEIRGRPALLGLAALVRQQMSGDVAAMEGDLMRAARLLQRESTSDPSRRVANLTLAALCLLLSSQPDDAVVTARRAAALLSDINESGDTADAGADDIHETDRSGAAAHSDRLHRLASAACDLAGIFAVVGDTPMASRLWAWVRSVVADPSSPLLAQVDIGLSCAAIFTGDRMRINPAGHRTIAAHRHGGLWQALVMSARCYDALDDLSPQAALDASRSAVAMLPDPYALGSLVSAHVMALIASGHPDWAVDYLAAVERHASPSAADSPLGQSRALLRVSANAAAGNASAAAVAEQWMPESSPLRALASAYRSLWAGSAGEAAAVASGIHDGILSPRLESLRRVISAAARLRAGRGEVALAELTIFGSLAELQGVRWAMLIIPRTDVAALAGLAASHGATDLLRHFPDPASVRLDAVARVAMTERETEILELVARGLTNSQIAERVFISANTVKYHLARIYRRIGVTTRDEAVAFAYRLRPLAASEDTTARPPHTTPLAGG